VLAACGLATLNISPSAAATGDSDTYFTFNGTTQYGQSPEGTTFDARLSYALEAWINPTSTTCSSDCSIANHDGDYSLFINGGVLKAYIYYNGTGTMATINSNQYITANTWQHVALVKNGGSVLMYLNGSLIETSTIAGATSKSTYANDLYPFKVGWQYNTQFFPGAIDEVRLYSTSITQAQIQSDMNNWGPFDTSGLVAYYDFNDATTSLASNKVSGSTSASDMTIYNTPTLSNIESSTITSGYKTVTFPRSYLVANGGYKIPDGVTSVSALIVGGGGGGGMDGGGGGGGGGVYENTVSVTPGSYADVEVGGGGPGGTNYEPAPACTTLWQAAYDNVGCKGGNGSASKFVTVTAGGGGGGGGIENSGNDAPTGFTIRGSGGGVGGQNNKNTTGTPGAGNYRGGNVANNSANTSGSGGGGATANGYDGSGNSGGAGGEGVTATMNSLIYGAGGGGGTYGGATAALGGNSASSGAGSGGATGTTAASIPAFNRGGGGGGGGNGSNGLIYSAGGAGAAGVVIIKFALKAVGAFSYSGTPTYRAKTDLTVTTNSAAKVTFYANGKKIPGCSSLLTQNLVATCSWKPSSHNPVSIYARVVPTDSNYASSTVTPTAVAVANRSGKR
jgi:hypothetical protein